MKILITGAGGFMGPHIIEFLVNKGHEVLGTYYSPTTDITKSNPKAQLIECDITNKDKLKTILASFRPDRIFHLAAQSYPTVSWDKPQLTFYVNAIGTINLFESLRELKLDPVILVACSSAEYGYVKEEEVPIKEDHPLLPLHPYGVTKVAQDLLTYQYFKNYGQKGIRARIFNTTGPKKINDVCADFTKRAVMIKKGLSEPVMKVGNLETRRALTDVRDLIRGFWLLTEMGEYGQVYNLSGSKVYKIGDILELVLREVGLENVRIEQDPKLMRPTDEPIIFGSTERLEQQTGWKQEIPIEKTIKDMIAHWEKVL